MNSLFLLGIILLIPTISLIDYVLFSRWLKCERCGFIQRNVFAFLPATLIEILLFIAGVAVGCNLL